MESRRCWIVIAASAHAYVSHSSSHRLSNSSLIPKPQDGTVLTYPPSTAYSVHDPSSALGTYSFGRNFVEHKFCSICGVSVYIHKKEHIPEEQWKKWKGDASQETWRGTTPVNLRCFEGVEWEELRKEGMIRRTHLGAKLEPLYVCPE